jgi:AcrR family transcriptional regulator
MSDLELASTAAAPPGLRERQKAQRRQRMLEAAVSLFRNKGYDETTIEEIADRADVSVPTLYRYFNSKRDMLLAAIEQDVEDLLAAGSRVLERPQGDAVDAFSALLFAHLRDLFEPKRANALNLWRIAYSEAIRAADDYSARYFDQSTRALEAQAEQLCDQLKARGHIPDSVDTHEIAALMNLISQGHIRIWLLGRGDSIAKTKASIRRQVKLVIGGLRA